MRKPGWYWVKVIDGGKWGCFLWNGSAWEGESDRYSDEMFDVVGPRIPPPDEADSSPSAAAPELCGALEELVKQCGHPNISGWVNIERSIAALTKARGES